MPWGGRHSLLLRIEAPVHALECPGVGVLGGSTDIARCLGWPGCLLEWQISSGWRHGRARVQGPSSGGRVLGWLPPVGFPAAPHCLHPPSPEQAKVGTHGRSVTRDCLFCLLPCTPTSGVSLPFALPLGPLPIVLPPFL